MQQIDPRDLHRLLYLEELIKFSRKDAKAQRKIEKLSACGFASGNVGSTMTYINTLTNRRG
jgi:hypothetical protein